MDKQRIYIINNTEDGIHCEVIRKDDFPKWVSERTEDIKPECLPKFLKEFPTEYNDSHEYFIFEANVIIPKPVAVVQTYYLE